MEEAIIPVSKADRFTFQCTAGVSCFNDCCRDLNQYLSPFDILKIKTHLGMRSGDFLSKYTRTHIGQESGLPVITLKTDPSTGFQCPFVQAKGCCVYENRPTSCRLYPLARALTRSRKTGLLTEQYFLIKETHCRGFENGPEHSVQQWIDDQDVGPYIEMNDLMMDVIRQKNSFHLGPLDPKSSHLFHLACYDLDAFRAHILEKKWSGPDLPVLARTDSLLDDDIALLKFALGWIATVLFAPAV